MAKAKATIRDVAMRAGVSVATVSRLLNGSDKILPETKQRVLDAMAHLEFAPSQSARNLATNRTGSLGLLLSTITGDFFTPLLGGIEEWASKAGYSMLTASTGRWSASSVDQPPLGPRNCDGLMVVAGTLPDAVLLRWASEGFPVVVLYGDSPAGSGIPSVVLDNRDPVRRVVEHLHKVHGRRKFVFLAGSEGNYDALRREEGFWDALDALGLDRGQAVVRGGDFDRTVSRNAVRQLVAEGVDFDAIVAADDESAFGALQALREAGRSVPEHVSLTGFDDQMFASMIQPTLTTVVSPSEQLGQTALNLLLSRIKGETVPERTTIATHEVWRESCGCHPLEKY